MDFLDDKIDKYVTDHSSPESAMLFHLNRETHLKVMSPRMLSGHLQGRVLSMLSHMIQPKLIVEIGTYTGYSAYCLAEGLTEKGKLITIDRNEELKPIIDKYLSTFEKKEQIDVVFGNAMEIIPSLPDEIDIAFTDADKENYSNYYDLLFDKIRPGGYLLADNVLWSGKVVEEVASNDRSTKAIMEFNNKVHEDARVENVLFPIRDGIMVMRKK